MKNDETYSISELASHFGITTRTIRYYEEIGLLKPMRSDTGQRIFSKKERIRLQLVFRGKKYGFSLDEIREMIQLFDRDPSGKKQLKKTIEYGQKKVGEVSDKIDDLMMLRTEMESLIADFQTKLTKLEGEVE
ncbi:MerR family transcriptional regulator [Terrihalobacillus insolitus]|uniref:MerR family transcriptional regulator n=1 Tax=Terrihalobacillus insolitus TaxID=2950438 RepID=UPI00234284D6|nr:MerR family DNA-binding transcriptional regulator [Terrihalobacillus insolitus]MDC3411896.1 MerR family DNA-binding transcriptional regulator [Terrihalobacillus insolitus]